MKFTVLSQEEAQNLKLSAVEARAFNFEVEEMNFIMDQVMNVVGLIYIGYTLIHAYQNSVDIQSIEAFKRAEKFRAERKKMWKGGGPRCRHGWI